MLKITPLSHREALIKQRLEVSCEDGEVIYDFRSDILTPKVISLPIDVPVYRMGNCRTFSAQQTEIARKKLAKDYFEKGQELASVQQMQHKILVELSGRGSETVTPIITVLKDEGQREKLLITSTGVVVNGNRRLAAMRELSIRNDGSIDDRFTNALVAVLPSDVTLNEIDDLEADFQAKRETKLEYDWISDASLIRRQANKGRTAKQIAERLRRTKADVENALLALDEADLYLSEWMNKPGEYDLVNEGQQIFGDLPKAINNKDTNLQNASRAIAWSIYTNREKISGRVYRLNATFGKLAPKVLELLNDQLDLPASYADEDDEDDFAVDIETDATVKDYTPIIKALRNDKANEDTIDTLLDACETAIELDKGQKNENAALKTLSQVHSKVIAIDIRLAGSSTLSAIINQIESIRNGLNKIEVDIQARKKGSTSKEEEAKIYP